MVRFTIAAAKIAGVLSRLLRRGSGDSLPGLVAGRLDPAVAAVLASQLTGGIIMVTGTNGKTTTTKLLGDMLTASGERIVTNRTGSNLQQGIVTALINASNRRGVLRGAPTVGVFEVDEAALASVVRLVGAAHILVTNLFRDQLDRYGELDATAEMIGRGIAVSGARVYLNADDPMVTSLAQHAGADQVTYFGLQQGPEETGVGYLTVVDSDRCPVCGDALTVDLVFYGHLGHYHCRRGHFSRPEPDVAVWGVQRSDTAGSEFTCAVDGAAHRARLPFGGVYNVYNALAAVAVAAGLGVPMPTVLASLSAASPPFGRMERLPLRRGNLLLILVKNPAGFTQVLRTFLQGQDRPKILIVVNDFAADGRDVSWLWDVPFESLAASSPFIVVAGSRAADVALRLHYAGIGTSVATSLEAALTRLRESLADGETGFVLPTYTAMVQMRRTLAKMPKAVTGRR